MTTHGRGAPAHILLNGWIRFGLRPCVFVGATLNAAGQWVRVSGADKDGFVILFVRASRAWPAAAARTH